MFKLSWAQSSPVLSPPSPTEGLNPRSSIFSVFQSFSVSVLFSPSQSFSVLIHIFELKASRFGLGLIWSFLMYLAIFVGIPVTIYTYNGHFGNYSFYQRQIFTFIFDICFLYVHLPHARYEDVEFYIYSQLDLKKYTLRFINILY